MNLHIPSIYHPPEPPTTVPGHFWHTAKLGIRRPVWHCWCGDTLQLDYSERGQASRLYAFCDAHIDCVPPDAHTIDEEIVPA